MNDKGANVDVRKALLRSWLSVPSTDTDMMNRGLESTADTIFFDLEDSVPENRKVEARKNAIDMATRKRPGTILGLRINAWTTRFCYRDVIEVVGRAGGKLDYIVLPKTEGPEEVFAVTGLLRQVEDDLGVDHRILIQADIESAAGLLAAHDIVHASKRVFCLLFAPEGLDFTADMGFFEGVSPRFLDAAAVIPLAAARARGVQFIDGPYVHLDDLAGLRQRAGERFRMGFDGMWAVHPGQVETINDAFAPTAVMVAAAESTVRAYEQAVEAGRGATSLNRTMVDQASHRLARAALARSATAVPRSASEGR